MKNEDPSDTNPDLLQLQEKVEGEVAKQKSGQMGDSEERVKAAEVISKEHEYVTGFKLSIIIASVTLVAFLIMLDTSIIATVSLHSIKRSKSTQMSLGDPSHY
jgi:hypothetical protein